MKRASFAEDRFCGHQHFSVIKGISILLIVIVHLCRYLDFTYLSPFAGAGVAVFLLCSGYGLSESFLCKGGLQGFWPNKIVKIWIPSFVKLSFFALVGLRGVLMWLTEYPLFLYGWYLQVLFGEYLVFWLLFRFVKNGRLRLFGLFAASVLAFVLIRNQLYAEQMFCFPIGVAFSQCKLKDKMERWGWLQKIALVGICGFVAAAAFLMRHSSSSYLLLNGIWMLFKLSLAILICFVPYYLRKLHVFSIFAPLGSISYMLYLINNDILALLTGNVRWYTVAGVLVLLVLAAVGFKWLCDKISDGYTAILKRKAKA